MEKRYATTFIYSYAMARLAIIGSRDFNNYKFLEETCKNFIKQNNIINPTIISGGAKGADSFAEIFASICKYKFIKFPAEWDKYGKQAGIIRNEKIINNSDIVLAFWDGKSRGTQHSINIAKSKNIPIYIYFGVKYDSFFINC